MSLVVVTLSMGFVACSSDDDYEGSVEGNSYYYEEVLGRDTYKYTLTFTSSTTATCKTKCDNWVWDEDGYVSDPWTSEDKFSYSVSGNVITFKNWLYSNAKNCGSYLEVGNNKEKWIKQEKEEETNSQPTEIFKFEDIEGVWFENSIDDLRDNVSEAERYNSLGDYVMAKAAFARCEIVWGYDFYSENKCRRIRLVPMKKYTTDEGNPVKQFYIDGKAYVIEYVEIGHLTYSLDNNVIYVNSKSYEVYNGGIIKRRILIKNHQRFERF